MLILSGFNFTDDISAVDPFPSVVDNINNITLQNGIFDYFNITKDVTSAYSSSQPTA